jgi:Uma2 family endonuclease
MGLLLWRAVMTTMLKAQHLRIAAADNEAIVDLAALQGMWTPAQYLAITDHSRRLIEFSDGAIEVLPMPTDQHQLISRWLLFTLVPILQQIGGMILYAPLRLRIREGVFREPDLLLVCSANDPRRQNRFWLGADMVIEIVSSDDPERDTVDKVADYAEAAVQEYWIVNPLDETISILILEQTAYTRYGVFVRGQTARSLLLPDFVVDVAHVFDQT